MQVANCGVVSCLAFSRAIVHCSRCRSFVRYAERDADLVRASAVVANRGLATHVDSIDLARASTQRIDPADDDVIVEDRTGDRDVVERKQSSTMPDNNDANGDICIVRSSKVDDIEASRRDVVPRKLASHADADDDVRDRRHRDDDNDDVHASNDDANYIDVVADDDAEADAISGSRRHIERRRLGDSTSVRTDSFDGNEPIEPRRFSHTDCTAIRRFFIVSFQFTCSRVFI
jgi:hypothetical protein